jgi:hypothetical protein
MTIIILKRNLFKSALVAAMCSLAACGSETVNPPAQEVEPVNEAQTTSSANSGFYDFPQPIQQVQILQKAGAIYDRGLLNPLENVPKYTLTTSKALNLGIYGADLSYSAVFNQSQDVILYLSASKKLSEELNMKGDFYPDIMKRMEKSSGNKDSLMQIVSDVYRSSNEALKENDQSHISALVVVGSFVEAMYIGTQVAKDVKDKDVIYKRIGEFKSSLNNLVALIATAYDSDFANILPDLRNIKAIYDESEGTELNEDQMKRITKQVKAVRIRITNM